MAHTPAASAGAVGQAGPAQFQIRDGLVVDIRDGAGHDDAVAATDSGSPQQQQDGCR
jgi:hypothetical protein